MNKRFFTRNFFLVALPVLLVAVILGGTAIFLTLHNSKENIILQCQRTNVRIAESSQLIFDEVDTQSLNYSVFPHTMIKLQKLLNEGYTDKDNLNTSYMIKSFLDANVNSKRYIHSLYIYLKNPQKNFFASSVGFANQQNFKDVDWLDTINKNEAKQKWIENRTVSVYALSDHSVDVVTIYRTLYSPTSSETLGAVVLNIDQSIFGEFLMTFVGSEDVGVVVLNSDGSSIVEAGRTVPLEALRDQEQFEKSHIVSQTYDPEYGITYYTFIPKSSIVSQASNMILLVTAVIFIAFLLGTALAAFLSHRDSKSIVAIINLLASAEEGEELVVNKTYGSEYDFILQNILQTFLHNNQLDKQLLEKKYQLEAMHFSFLQSQLNPHFLFNTLKNIFWKTVKMGGGINDASRMIELLTSLLHYTLVDPNRFVPFADEIENTKKYIEIQQMRFDDNFSVVWKVEPSMNTLKCIKFLLQPLVENSITHGFSQNNFSEGEIEIIIEPELDRINIAVSDNGKGFTEENLHRIRALLQQDMAPERHIGLYNTNQRLLLAYGEKSAIAITSVPNQRTTLSFSIPMEEEMTNRDRF